MDKAPHSASMLINLNPTNDILFLYDLCYLEAEQITSLEGDFPYHDCIWGLFNPIFNPSVSIVLYVLYIYFFCKYSRVHPALLSVLMLVVDKLANTRSIIIWQ